MSMLTSENKVPNRAYCDKENIVNLNFYNFETAEASNCPYILTSPRSLKACSLANIKPIELLHRTASEIAKDLDASTYSVNHIYTDYEQERLRKLEICKLIRKHMLISSEIVHDSTPKIIHSSPNIFSYRDSTSRSSYYTIRGDSPDSSFLRDNKLRSPFSTPTTPAPQFNPLRKTKSCRSLRCSLSSSSSSTSSLTVGIRDSYPKRSKSLEEEKNTSVISKKITKRNTSSLKKRSEKHVKKNRNDLGKRYREVEKMNDQQLCWQIDNVKSSGQSKMNKTKSINATKPKQTFESKKLKNKQNSMEQNNFIKNCEKAINGKTEIQKFQKNKKNVKLNQDLVPDNNKNIGKQSKARSDLKKINDKYNENIKKKEKNMTKACDDNYDGMEGLKNHDVKILDALTMKRELQQSQENLSQKARVMWATSPNDVSFPWTKISNEKHSGVKVQKVDNAENPSFETYFNHIKNKMKQFKEDSLHKELHAEQVRQLARELQAGMEQWQDQVLLLQWHALQKARTNAKLHIENKRLKTQCENNERALLHALRLKNVQDMERIKQSCMKKEIEQKDWKIEKLKMKREREIMDCRAQAHYTADLREQLRRTLTPETFDQKVNDVIVKTKFINRSLTASPFTESHIRLG